MKTKRAFFVGFGCALLLAAAFIGREQFGVFHARAAEREGREAVREKLSPPQVVVNTNPLPKDTRGITSFAPVVKVVAPSVVTIYSTKIVKEDLRQLSPFFNDPLFRRFFGIPEDEEEGPVPRRAPRQREQQSLGSGVIVSADGYILSNNHVVEGADEVKVALSETDEEVIAKVIGTDPQTDISVLKIDRKDLKPITMTDSDHLQVGDLVLAVGNPFGVGQTVTMGIVSATGRGRFGIVDYEDFIQTDAAINRGNSGGALVDAEGRLVGINTAIISPTGGSIGIGFAIPINMARGVMDSIIGYGKVTRGFLGVNIGDISPSLAEKFKLKNRSGAFVQDVQNNTPAAKAGLQPYDVITEFNGRRVPDSRQLRLWVSQTPPNTKANLKVLRDGRERTINVTLGELPTQALAGGLRRGETPSQQGSDVLDGVEVADLDQRTRRQFEIPTGVTGALITNVDPESTAAVAGLRPGDVIVEIERQKVRDAQELIDQSGKLRSDEPILLRVWGSGRAGGPSGTRVVVVEPEKKNTRR